MIIDFETRSKADLKVCGTYLYAADPSTEVLCMSITTEDGYSMLWKPGEPDPVDLLLHIVEGGTVSAHNAVFEMEIWRNIMVPKFGWPEVPTKQWECTMARCAQMGLPKRLGNVGEFLELDEQKDDKGHRVMMKLSKPNKDGDFVGTSEELQTLYEYCIQDGVAEMHVHNATLPLSERERVVWQLDQTVNRRGIPVDVPLARAVCRIWADYLKQLNAELASVTGGEVDSVSQIARIKKFLGKFNLSRESLGADEIDSILKGEEIDPVARKVLEIRREGGASAVSKFPAILNAVGPDNRVRGCFAYHSASTGRWGGRIIQPQNLSRGIFGEDAEAEIEAVIDVVKLRDLEILQSLYPNIGDLFGSLVRPCIQAPEGKKLIVADFAAVEARGVAWVAGQQSLLDAFKKGEDVYKIQASSIYKKPVSEISKAERFFGKTCLAGDTLVLTHRGSKPITCVTKQDRVWDGFEWVSHDGLLYQGEREVWYSDFLGIRATPDHVVYKGGKQTTWASYMKEFHLDDGKIKKDVVPVFDLANCGPRRRFAIRGELGELIVSNCVLGAGYQLGATGFQNQCEAQGVSIDSSFAEKAIKAYRQSNRYIVQFWESIQKAAIATVKTGMTHKLKSCDVRFITKGKWLAMQLPSGRRIYYYKPTVKEGKFGDSLHFVGVGKNDKAWNESTYGGKLTENLVQAICRDILVEKMFRLESMGYPVIMHVHDEVVLEVPEDFGSAEEVRQVMAEEVSWAKGFPISSEVFEAKRYRK